MEILYMTATSLGGTMRCGTIPIESLSTTFMVIHRQLLFRRVPLHTTDGGQMAVGVIGAVCTVGAAANIGFTTQNKIGMISWFLSSNWYPAWGGSSFNKYDKFGTTDLSVRIYQAHPREDMLYDSRFFSVHHFNPGTSLSDGTQPCLMHMSQQQVKLKLEKPEIQMVMESQILFVWNHTN